MNDIISFEILKSVEICAYVHRFLSKFANYDGLSLEVEAAEHFSECQWPTSQKWSVSTWVLRRAMAPSARKDHILSSEGRKPQEGPRTVADA